MLPPDYVISEVESAEALKIWLNEQQYRALSDDERETIDVLMDANKLGCWPVTVSEVLDHRTKEKYEAERKRIASWRNEGRISAYDFSCYEQQLADGEDGPFVNFMRVAASLKQSGHHNLTVGDVRAEIKKAA